eukprot:m51a1_g6275 hypothetical protein (406) ;mRNA; r:179583-180800
MPVLLQRRVPVLYAAILAFAACVAVVTLVLVASPGAPEPSGPASACASEPAPRPCPASTPGAPPALVAPAIERQALAGHPYNVVFNPSAVGSVAAVARCPRDPVVALYRDVRFTHRVTSFVTLHAWRMPASGFAGRVADCAPGRAVLLDAPDTLQGKHKCEMSFSGYEDPRGIVTADGSLLVFVNNMRPTDCKRRIAVLRTTLARALAASAASEPGAASAAGLARLEVPSVTWLSFDERQQSEKNWVPFAEGPASTVVVSYSLEPHVVLSCPLGAGESSTCAEVARTEWPELKGLLQHKGTTMRPSSVPIHRRDYGDYIAVGHYKDDADYSFFFYTFQADPPYALTGASESFHFAFADRWQYVSGLALLGDHYVATFSVHDNNTLTATWNRCDVDSMVSRFRRSP